MLASVVDAEEAAVALQLGADVVDLKDPRRGFPTTPCARCEP
jgi:uncharacterized protein (UPF0264 family)